MAQQQQRRRIKAVDPIMGRSSLAAALDVTPQTASRRLARSAATRSGLWPQLVDESGRVVVRASVVDAYINALPCLEDVPERRQVGRAR